MTTLEMLNASKEEPGVKFRCVSPTCYSETYCLDGKFRYDFTCQPAHGFNANVLMQLTWEREKPEPLRGEIEFEVEFNGYGTVLTGTGVVGRAIRKSVTGDSDNTGPVRNKRFHIKGTVEEII